MLYHEVKQESRAIAKITAWCTQCMGDLKMCRIPCLCIWLLFPKFPDTPKKFLMGFCSDGPCICFCRIWSLWFYPFYEIIAIEVWGRGENPNSGRGGRRVSGMIPFERGLMTSYRHSIVTFPLSLPVSEILPFLCTSASFFFPPDL